MDSTSRPFFTTDAAVSSQELSIARDAKVKELWLTHYSPSLTKPEEYMDDVREIFPAAVAAKDRRSVELVFS